MEVKRWDANSKCSNMFYTAYKSRTKTLCKDKTPLPEVLPLS